ncbi:hypothetical protein FPSE_11120 [Fusarium pseudograminearum CS3096]|uniref:Uncharacterized protein n=1 Tax=Fusarium pseudograminearum (strain CS3096) TaxID=1028729 RepID=K3V9M2_FUSPC|nr:hypothetical protein FPSE_11120 [Fusarium pseudograminearum CS3096]EKJ68703.1 hypothetical protein FPSE_11120 [Fusarium pseudograminearum CS3096]
MFTINNASTVGSKAAISLVRYASQYMLNGKEAQQHHEALVSSKGY